MMLFISSVAICFINTIHGSNHGNYQYNDAVLAELTIMVLLIEFQSYLSSLVCSMSAYAFVYSLV